MYINLCPLDIRTYERETSVSLFSLLNCNLDNGISLFSLLRKCSWIKAQKSFDALLQTTSLREWYDEVLLELIELGYLMNPDDATPEDAIISDGREVYWSMIWEKNYANVVKYGITYADYWAMPPFLMRAVAEKKSEQLIEEWDTMLTVVWLAGIYIRTAYHNPKEYPEEANTSENRKAREKEETFEESSTVIAEIKRKYGKK